MTARAPQRSATGGQRWRLDVEITTSSQLRSADARILSDDGVVVASRTVTDKKAGTCVALVRAVGAWAQIVLDDELAHAEEVTSPVVVPPPPRPPLTVANEGEADSLPPPAEDKGRSVEIGTNVLLRYVSVHHGGIFGASTSVNVGLSRLWMIRNSVFGGKAIVRFDRGPNSNLVGLGGRVDVCRRFRGNYIDSRGVEIDACTGSDVMYLDGRGMSAWASSVGPTVIIRGEVGALALEVRGMAGANLVRTDPSVSLFAAALEVGGAVRFQ